MSVGCVHTPGVAGLCIHCSGERGPAVEVSLRLTAADHHHIRTHHGIVADDPVESRVRGTRADLYLQARLDLKHGTKRQFRKQSISVPGLCRSARQASAGEAWRPAPRSSPSHPLRAGGVRMNGVRGVPERTGIAPAGCSRHIMSSGGLFQRSPSGTSASSATPRPADISDASFWPWPPLRRASPHRADRPAVPGRPRPSSGHGTRRSRRAAPRPRPVPGRS
jgi:hypothetical protein